MEETSPLVIKLFPLFNLGIGDVIRFTAEDALTKQEGKFFVQVVALTLNRNLQWIPVFKFFETDFHLFVENRARAFIPKNGALANGGFSVPNIPTDEFLKLVDVVALDHDFAFLNYDGSADSVYAAKVAGAERAPNVKLQIDQTSILRFAMVLSVREIYARLATSRLGQVLERS